MNNTLVEIAKRLKDTDKKVQLIYAFNGTGKTRLSREFKNLVDPKTIVDKDDNIIEQSSEFADKKILYYSAFTEDLFHWDNDLDGDAEPKLKILPNAFTRWVFLEQGFDKQVTKIFQDFTNNRLTPYFDEEFTQATFKYKDYDGIEYNNVKISKGEESNFVWSVFYTFFQAIIEELNENNSAEGVTSSFEKLDYVFIDDPVSSLDDNHLIDLAVALAKLIKSSKSRIKFIIATHNPLFFNILSNEFNNSLQSDNKSTKEKLYKKEQHVKYRLKKSLSESFTLVDQKKDSPFSYHIYLLSEIDNAINNDNVQKFHFSFMRNILEKLSTFLGYDEWKELLPNELSSKEDYYNRILNLSSHSKHSGEETSKVIPEDKEKLEVLVGAIKKTYKFKNNT